MKSDARRDFIWQELHARPYVRFSGAAHVFHFAFFTGEGTADSDLASLERVKNGLGLEATYETPRHAIHAVDLPGLGRLAVSWERHNEFVAFTFFLYDLEIPFEPFALDPHQFLPPGFPESAGVLPLVATCIAVGNRSQMPATLEGVSELFEQHTVNGSGVMNGRAEAWSAYRVHRDGFNRIALIFESGSPHSIGRTVERLLAIENFYHLALLSLPLARQVRSDLAAWESRAVVETEALRVAESLTQKRSVLQSFFELSAEVEEVRARVSSQFAASSAYFTLLENRFAELRETKIEHALRLSRFVMRRLAPAAQTCRSVLDRLTHLAQRIDRAAHLLRTSIGLHVEEQNQQLLASADRRARLQLELQVAVESLSIVAIAYYMVGLIGHVLHAFGWLGWRIDAEATLGTLAPVLLLTAWAVMRLVRRRIER
jgi:uncharacterized membrane-anchored protein